MLTFGIAFFLSCSSDSDTNPINNSDEKITTDDKNTSSSSEKIILKDQITEVVDVINPVTGKTWMDRNLGASRVAISNDDSLAFGDLYQWGRGSDGHEKRTSDTTSILSESDNPGHGKFILSSSDFDYNWRISSNNSLWQGVDGINNPCPKGYRLPTETEWDEEIDSWKSTDETAAFESNLKLIRAYYREWNAGSLIFLNTKSGNYWSSTVSGSKRAKFLYFNSSSGSVIIKDRAFAHSVRCIKD